jgi:hypothetical protein
MTASLNEIVLTSQVISPTFTICIKNEETQPLSIPKRTILSPHKNRYSFINTQIEEFSANESCQEKFISEENKQKAPLRCNICFFGSGESDYLLKEMKILRSQTFSLKESILCYEFIPGKFYRVKFSLDPEKIGAVGETEWIYFQIPK